MHRLEALSSDIAAKWRHASEEKQRAASLLATEHAIAKSGVKNPLVDQSLRQLRAGHLFSPQEKSQIDILAMQLDEQYFNLQEAAEFGEIPNVEYLKVFAKARAVSALLFAGSGGSDATADSIYEAAAAAGEDNSYLLSLVESSLV